MTTIISLVSYPFLPARQGGQKNIALFNKYFSKHYHLICLATKKNDINAAEGYTVVNRISNSQLRYINPFLVFLLCRYIKKEKASHLMLEHPYYGWLGVLVKWFSGARLIIRSQNIEAERWKTLKKWWWPILFQYEKISHRFADINFFIQDEDLKYALEKFKLSPQKCDIITYGIEWNVIPLPADRQACREQLNQYHSIDPQALLLLFNGTLDYAPNLQALKVILDTINPLLLQSGTAYKIIICGKGLPAEMNGLQDYADRNIIYTGFVDDISVYFKGVDTFINPVVEGGGIKTKLVEALGYNLNAVSTVSGAIGISLEITGEKMQVVGDEDWNGFAAAIISSNNSTDIPSAFFDHFYWGNIAEKASRIIDSGL